MTDADGNTVWEDRLAWTFETNALLVDNKVLDFSEDGGIVENPFELDIEVGGVYEVIFDGDQYECVAYYEDGLPANALGNMSLLSTVAEDSGEPFVLLVLPDGRVAMVVQKAGVHTVSITKAESEVKKIDNKFLPTPDWNQNDKRSPDYVKNRTHWVEIAMVEVVPKTKFVTDEYRGSVSANVPSVTPEEGKKVIISLDGVDYNCEWVKRDDTYVVGDPENMADPPFALYTGEGNSEGTIYFASGSAGEEHTIGMSEEGEKYHALDRGFLPGSIDTLVGNAFIIQDGSPYLHLLGSGAKASVHQFVAAVEKTFGIPMIIDGDTGLLTSIIMYQPDYGDCARVGFFKYDEATGVATFEIRYTSEYQLPDS